MATAVAELLAAQSFRPALLVGHSAGAAVAVRLCLDGALAPAAVIAINGALLPLDGLMGQLFPRAARLLARVPMLPQLVAARARRSPLIDDMIAQTGSPPAAVQLAQYRQLSASAAHVGGTLRMMAQWDLPALERELYQLRTPLHLFACANDRAVPAAQARYLAARMDNAQLHMVPGLGHLGHEEQPQQFAAAILELAGIAAATS
jgi:magnesium chelatase accessory protein